MSFVGLRVSTGGLLVHQHAAGHKGLYITLLFTYSVRPYMAWKGLYITLLLIYLLSQTLHFIMMTFLFTWLILKHYLSL